MEERALAFDYVPMCWGSGWRQHLRCTGYEVRNDGVDRNTVAGDQYSRLPARAEVRIDSTRAHRSCECESGVLLAERAIRADGEQALASAWSSSGNRDQRRWDAHIHEIAAAAFRDCLDFGVLREPHVHATHNVEAGMQALHEAGDPFRGQHPTAVGDADDDRPRSAL